MVKIYDFVIIVDIECIEFIIEVECFNSVLVDVGWDGFYGIGEGVVIFGLIDCGMVLDDLCICMIVYIVVVLDVWMGGVFFVGND